MSKWTEAETQLLYNLKIAGKSYSEIGKILSKNFGLRNYSRDSLKHRWARIDKTSFQLNRAKKLVNKLKEDKESEKRKIIEKTLANNERIARLEETRTQIIIDNIKSSIFRLPKPKLSDITYKPKSRRKKYSSEHVGVMISDMHVGAAYTHEDTGGLSEYNLDIFKRRLQKMKHALLEIVERHQAMYDLPELHIFCLGDIIAGAPGNGIWNHNYIDLSVTDQMMEGVQALHNVIATWSNVFQKVTFYGIYGNHGRVGKKGQSKTSDNWDRVCYTILRLALMNYDNIKWYIPRTWWLNPTILGHNFYLCHGDGIKGTTISEVEKAESKIAGMLEQRLDYLLMGHFHSSAEIQTNCSRVIMNGCFVPETQVWMSDGTLIPIKKIKPGYRVIGKDLKATKITNVSRRPHKGEIVCFQVVGNSSIIKCTPNHKMFGIKANKLANISVERFIKGMPEFIEAKYLGVGDYLAQISNNNLPNEEKYTFNLNRRENCPTMLKWWDGRIIDKTMSRFLGYYLAKGANGILTNGNGKDFSEAIAALCGKGSEFKQIDSDFAENLPQTLQLEVLIGYLQKNGHLCETTHNNNSLMAASISKSIRDQMAYFSINCGYIPYIKEQKENRRKTLYWLIFRGEDAIDLSFRCEMPFNKEFNEHSNRNFLQCGDYTMRKITQCYTEQYDGDVFDLEVSKQESYNVEGLICHNSFMGGDMYSLQDLGKNAIAEQKVFGIHKKKGITWTYNIYLNEDY